MAEEHTVINIIHKEGEESVTTNSNTLDLNLDDVEVHTRNAYAVLTGVDSQGSDVVLDGGTVENVGAGVLKVSLPCEDVVYVNASKLIATLLRACDLPISDQD